MKNEVIFAAAGYGKTYSICNKAKKASKGNNKNILLISYTNEGVNSLKREYKKQNEGVLGKNIIIKTWYSWILSDFIKPYQQLLRLEKSKVESSYVSLQGDYIQSIIFPNQHIKGLRSTTLDYYINGRDVISYNASQLAYKCNQDSNKKVINRMQKIYSHIFIDELQDYAGWDLELIKLLFLSEIKITCVGDCRQSTYQTHNPNKNRQYKGANIKEFFLKQRKEGLCDILSENTTRRMNKVICDFVNLIYSDDATAAIQPFNAKEDFIIENSGVYVIDADNLEEYCNYYNPTILRYATNIKIPF